MHILHQQFKAANEHCWELLSGYVASFINVVLGGMARENDIVCQVCEILIQQSSYCTNLDEELILASVPSN